MNSLTGAIAFPESSAAAKAYFDKVNASGGVNGHKIDYRIEDDKNDPQTAAQAARKLIDQEGVVAMAGGASILECSANSALYQQRGILSVPGTGVDPFCFNTPNIAPPNGGPIQGLALGLEMASTDLKASHVCAIGLNVQANVPGWEARVKDWEASKGKTITLENFGLSPTQDYTPVVSQVKNAGCDAVVFVTNDVQAIAIAQAAKAQNATDIAFIGLTSIYNESVARAVPEGVRMYAVSEFLPYLGSDAADLKDWRETMKAGGVPESSFSQGGYLAAKILVSALKTIKGEVTRKSVTEALHKVTAFKDPLMGNAYSFAPANAHAPNRSAFLVEVTGGAWKPVTGDWTRLPAGQATTN